MIVNFSDSAINRLGGFLDKDYDRDTIPLFTLDDVDDLAQTEEARIEVRKGKQAAALSLMDDFLGGPWWREVKRQGAATWVHQVRKEWMAKVITQAGPSWQATDVPVRDELGGPIAFHLILITESGAGLWKFNDGVSRAWKDFYESSPWITSADQGLFGTATEDLDSVLNDEMTEHLRNVAATGRSLTVGSDLRDVFGPTVGRAREMHLREAIKRLRAEGALAGAEPVGDLRNYRIVPANGSGISS